MSQLECALEEVVSQGSVRTFTAGPVTDSLEQLWHFCQYEETPKPFMARQAQTFYYRTCKTMEEVVAKVSRFFLQTLHYR